MTASRGINAPLKIAPARSALGRTRWQRRRSTGIVRTTAGPTRSGQFGRWLDNNPIDDLGKPFPSSALLSGSIDSCLTYVAGNVRQWD
ncbi:hypothetical protein CA13_52480 [Planctomycetes bacterium CA13]|uniref:Uncharacterized protein n=1 Tax=Novipirellula herctigrandis TaxID=2527986 RepID=A0A5C5Z9K3_9BACT|nr:hypothetical protein CA13_52480 [Planctomycetes bacterium CA13]